MIISLNKWVCQFGRTEYTYIIIYQHCCHVEYIYLAYAYPKIHLQQSIIKTLHFFLKTDMPLNLYNTEYIVAVATVARKSFI